MKLLELILIIQIRIIADTSILETECDRPVYQLYRLTEAEIKIVEGVNDGK